MMMLKRGLRTLSPLWVSPRSPDAAGYTMAPRLVARLYASADSGWRYTKLICLTSPPSKGQSCSREDRTLTRLALRGFGPVAVQRLKQRQFLLKLNSVHPHHPSPGRMPPSWSFTGSLRETAELAR